MFVTGRLPVLEVREERWLKRAFSPALVECRGLELPGRGRDGEENPAVEGPTACLPALPWRGAEGAMTGQRCHTDCVEQPLSRAMRALGACVGSHPWPFFLVPMALAASLGAGFMRLKVLEANDIEEQFTPIGGPAKSERSLVRMHFPTDDSERFSARRLTTEGSFAVLIAVGNDSILTREAFAELLALDKAVRALRSETGLFFEEVCAKIGPAGPCNSPNPLLSAMQGDPARIEALLPSLTFPLFMGRVPLGFFLGGVTLDAGVPPARPVRAAKALRLLYFLQEDHAGPKEESQRWIHTFLQRAPQLLRSLNLTSSAPHSSSAP
nr:PREDICTED: patched domain-containing protein 3-like [Anolis carolinensis]|eukprot:XP_008110887.1 PREDICTED: patched domain-containing protein 3-like [Anolis carolinensis]